MPERLGVVRRYPYRELATGDERLLADAGLTAYLKRSNGRGAVDLMVAEGDVDRAKHLIESSPQLVEEWRDAKKCPRCHSVEAEPREKEIGLCVLRALRGCFSVTSHY